MYAVVYKCIGHQAPVQWNLLSLLWQLNLGLPRAAQEPHRNPAEPPPPPGGPLKDQFSEFDRMHCSLKRCSEAPAKASFVAKPSYISSA